MTIKSSITWIGIAALVVASLAITSPAEAQRRSAMQVGPKCAGGVGALFDEIEPVDLKEFEETAVLSMWEEEKLARDVYLALADIWQLPIFANIAQAASAGANVFVAGTSVFGEPDRAQAIEALRKAARGDA